MNILRNIDFRPKLVSSLRKGNYWKDKFAKDLMAGIIVGIVALPLAIAFGIASGVSPEKGITTAIVGGFIVSLLGGCNVQIGGPTGAFIVIVYGIIAKFGFEGLAVATLIAGVMMFLLGFFKLGTMIKFIPYPIVVGFTGGIAVTIFTTQIKDLFGLTIEEVPADFISKWVVYFQNISTINWWALGTGILSILIIIYAQKLKPFKKIPGSLAAILVMTVVCYLLRRFCGIDAIETIGDRFTINASLPAPKGFALNMETINMLIPSAFTIAILGSIESLLSATVADGVTGDRHNSNTELMAQGVANMVVPLFGGIPVTGAIARTMTNINNGGRTPMAGIIHAVILLLILLFLAPLTKHIPMACLAGVLVVVSYNMSEWRTIRSMMSNPKADVAVLVTTLVLTIIFDLTIAIEVGLVLAVLLFMRRIMATTSISVIHDQLEVHQDGESSDEVLDIPEGVEVYEIEGPFFFGVANKFDEIMRAVGKDTKIRIARMRKVSFIDSTGLHNLEIFIKSSHKNNCTVILSGVNPTVRRTLEKAKINLLVGPENVCDNIYMALDRAKEVVEYQRATEHRHKE
ncbi:MAG: STAS domain-containing protein [Tidjanibacter sp.]|nr:STAS domain-containing protein [Tidjanibacter sp.]